MSKRDAHFSKADDEKLVKFPNMVSLAILCNEVSVHERVRSKPYRRKLSTVVPVIYVLIEAMIYLLN